MKIFFWILVIALFISCSSNSQPTNVLDPNQINKEFFKIYESKGNEPSLKYLFSTNKWIPENDFNNVNTKLSELTSQLGKYYGYELITQKKIGDRYVLYSFFVRYERQPVRFIMTYYKADSKWQLQIFEFDYDFQTGLRESANSYRLNENLPGIKNEK